MKGKMMHQFGDLCIGDMFNAKIARFVKTDVDKAIVVMSQCLRVGDEQTFYQDDKVILLWSAILEPGR